MATKWLINIMEEQGGFDADGNYLGDSFNTKEDAEVLKGLFIGRYAYEQFHDTHIVKKVKMYDLM